MLVTRFVTASTLFLSSLSFAQGAILANQPHRAVPRAALDAPLPVSTAVSEPLSCPGDNSSLTETVLAGHKFTTLFLCDSNVPEDTSHAIVAISEAQCDAQCAVANSGTGVPCIASSFNGNAAPGEPNCLLNVARDNTRIYAPGYVSRWILGKAGSALGPHRQNKIAALSPNSALALAVSSSNVPVRVVSELTAEPATVAATAASAATVQVVGVSSTAWTTTYPGSSWTEIWSTVYATIVYETETYYSVERQTVIITSEGGAAGGVISSAAGGGDGGSLSTTLPTSVPALTTTMTTTATSTSLSSATTTADSSTESPSTTSTPTGETGGAVGSTTPTASPTTFTNTYATTTSITLSLSFPAGNSTTVSGTSIRTGVPPDTGNRTGESFSSAPASTTPTYPIGNSTQPMGTLGTGASTTPPFPTNVTTPIGTGVLPPTTTSASFPFTNSSESTTMLPGTGTLGTGIRPGQGNRTASLTSTPPFTMPNGTTPSVSWPTTGVPSSLPPFPASNSSTFPFGTGSSVPVPIGTGTPPWVGNRTGSLTEPTSTTSHNVTLPSFRTTSLPPYATGNFTVPGTDHSAQGTGSAPPPWRSNSTTPTPLWPTGGRPTVLPSFGTGGTTSTFYPLNGTCPFPVVLTRTKTTTRYSYLFTTQQVTQTRVSTVTVAVTVPAVVAPSSLDRIGGVIGSATSGNRRHRNSHGRHHGWNWWNGMGFARI